MALTAMWTHGNAVIAETPDRLNELTRLGFGTQVQCKLGSENWFHVPMPTPVFLNGVRPFLHRLIILGRSEVSDCIEDVHVFDGPDRRLELRTLICGDQLQLTDFNVLEMRGPFQIFKGLGISMRIGPSTSPRSYFFAGFGADWDA